MYYQNVRGLNTKTTTLFDSVYTSYYPIIILTETWLKDNVRSSELFPPSYTVIRCDRTRCNGGGVLIAVDNDTCTCSQLIEITSPVPEIELVGVSINMNNNLRLDILASYIPPATSAETLEEFLEYLEIIVNSTSNNTIILGDFNIPGFMNEDPLYATQNITSLFSNFLTYINYKQINLIRNSNERILDFVVVPTSYISYVERVDSPLLIEDLHHPAISMSIDIKTVHNKRRLNQSLRYNFRKANFNLLYDALLNIDWSPVYQESDSDLCCRALYDIIYSTLDSIVPKTRITQTYTKYPVWFSKDLIHALKEKRYFHKLRSRGYFFQTKFAFYRSKVKDLLKRDRQNYTTAAELKLRSDPNHFWSYINSLGTNSGKITTLTVNNESISNPGTIVNTFAEWFGSVYSETIPSLNTEPCTSMYSTFDIADFSKPEIESILKRQKGKFTCGPDNIPSFLLKDCHLIFAQPLHHIFDVILKSNNFPKCWKTSKIIPVHKKGPADNVGNYRPIALINSFAKVFEMLLAERLEFQAKSRISDNQHGFCKGRSTTSNLVVFTEYVSRLLDKCLQVDTIYTDFSKAFDVLDHTILLNKLNQFGCSLNLLMLFESYLSDRTQYVEILGYQSNIFKATSGVPQGSNLGPVLFSIFINDLCQLLPENSLGYADDIKLFSVIRNAEDCNRLQSYLDMVVDWSYKNKLLLNISKCICLTYTRKRQKIIFNYHIGNNILCRQDAIKDLGVVFDSQLTFTQHIDAVSARAYRTLGFVIRNSQAFTDNRSVFLLYNSFVRSTLEYSSVVWSPMYNIHMSKIERVQRKMIKHMYYRDNGVYLPRGNWIYSEILDMYSLISLSERRSRAELSFLNKILNGNIRNGSVLSYINILVPRPNTRSSNMFLINQSSTNLGLYSPFNRLMSTGNDH